MFLFDIRCVHNGRHQVRVEEAEPDPAKRRPPTESALVRAPSLFFLFCKYLFFLIFYRKLTFKDVLTDYCTSKTNTGFPSENIIYK